MTLDAKELKANIVRFSFMEFLQNNYHLHSGQSDSFKQWIKFAQKYFAKCSAFDPKNYNPNKCGKYIRKYCKANKQKTNRNNIKASKDEIKQFKPS